jgi:hypothetical protein
MGIVEIRTGSNDTLQVPPAAYHPGKESGTMIRTSASSSQTDVSSTVIASSTKVSLDGKEIWEGYNDDIIPEKGRGSNLRHQVFTLYRRLFGVVFCVNMAVLIAILTRGTDSQHIGLVVISNLCVAILMRQDYIINIFFNTFCAVPAS